MPSLDAENLTPLYDRSPTRKRGSGVTADGTGSELRPILAYASGYDDVVCEKSELEGPSRFQALLESELPAAVDDRGISRRRWLQLMGASLTLAGASGCWPRQEILPFAQRPEGRVPGEPEYFATAMDFGGAAVGLIVTSRDGRPVKIEGNPQHPFSLGAAHAFAQASVLELYDPDRSRNVRERAASGVSTRTWDEFVNSARPHFAALAGKKGRGLCVLAESCSSPTMAAARARFQKAFPEAKWHTYEPLSDENVRAGAEAAFGKAFRTQFHFDKARVVLFLDSDLFAAHPAALRYAREFAQTRDPMPGQMSRVYAVESGYSITGATADHRLPLPSHRIASFVDALEKAVSEAVQNKAPAPPQDVEGRFLAALARDLAQNPGASLISVGAGQPPAVHAAAHRLHQRLACVGTSVTYTQDPDAERLAHVQGLANLAAAIGQGEVDTLLVLGGNPVYNAPSDLGFASLYEKVPMRIHLSLYSNETSRRSTWELPEAHFLESWSDARAFDGTYSIVQPLISPLYQGKTASELVATLLGEDVANGFDLVRAAYRQLFGEKDFDASWQKTLHDGFHEGSQWPAEKIEVKADTGSSKSPDATPGEGLELVFCRSAAVDDGRYANNGWLQEAPDPMTKVTWDNAAIIGPALARDLGIQTGRIVRLEYNGKSIEIPAYILPGQAAGSVAVALGYGRTAAGKVGGDTEAEVPPVGVDAYPLRSSSTLHFGRGLKVTPTDRKYVLASAGDHHAVDTAGIKGIQERAGQLVREATLGEYVIEPEFAQHRVHHPKLESLWEEWTYDGHRWGMSIDLNKCIGCNACVVACHAENNVPIVGRDLIRQGRDMHWIRIDRYFQGEPETPETLRVAHQMVACHHCENAPCEQVCPVAATVHSHEGLNDMVYNRCVGTRYCANNCPYKVRRFNFFYYHKDLDDPENEVKKMVFNPEVTVRTRGVMEKCTYCVQRIQAVKIDAKNARRPIADGEIQTACQQACPTRAIEFGDLADAKSQVAQAHAQPRAYGMLAELNVKPRTHYLARIRNPNPELEKPQPSDHDAHRHPG